MNSDKEWALTGENIEVCPAAGGGENVLDFYILFSFPYLNAAYKKSMRIPTG